MPAWFILYAINVWLVIASATTTSTTTTPDSSSPGNIHSLLAKNETRTGQNFPISTNNTIQTIALPSLDSISDNDTTITSFSIVPSSKTNNIYKRIDVECPIMCQCDQPLRNVNCSSTSLLELPSAIPHQVQHLRLDNNQIKHLTFLGYLPDLQTIDLSDNSLQTISADAFSGTPSLQELNLHGNLLNQSVAVDTLVTAGSSLLAHLAVLNVSNNYLVEWPIGECSDNSSLKVLDLSYNQVSSVPHLQMFQNLQSLFLQHNRITNLTHLQVINANETSENTLSNSTASNTSMTCPHIRTEFPHIEHIDVSFNTIAHIETDFFDVFTSIETLDLSHNMLQSVDFLLDSQLTNLSGLILSHNPIVHLPNNVFSTCHNLRSLHLSHMSQLAHINSNTFSGLYQLEELIMDHCELFHYIHATALSPLTSLQVLDLSFTGITSLHHSTFDSLTTSSNSTNNTLDSITNLRLLNLQGVNLTCSCDSAWLQHWSMLNSSQLIPSNLTCSGILEDNTTLSQIAISKFPFESLNCSGATIETVLLEQSVAYKIGSAVLFNCRVDGEPAPGVRWITPRNHVFTYHPSFIDHSDLEPDDANFHEGHYWHDSRIYYHNIPLTDRIYVLKNGSLYVDYVTRSDAGNYRCTANNHLGNETLVINMMLDYHIIIETRLWCAVVGVGSAFTFLLIGLTSGIIRHVANFCSSKEREKRRSIKELLLQIQEYKTEKVDVIKAYKSAKLDKISAFKNHKIDRLRLYKQSTVTNILAYMHSMREHYALQMAKIKDNYTEQTGKLCDNYTSHVTRIKDYRSEKIDRLRDNYQSQAIKLRDYGSAQMQRLREQYKVQQQHLLKLLELLDVGNCMSVIEAECMRTESIIFDPEMMFELEAPQPPVHAFLPPLSDDSEYITAGSVSDLSCASTLGQPRKKTLKSTKCPNKPQVKVADDKLKHKKRRRQHSANVHALPQWLDLADREGKFHESSPEQEGLPTLKTDKPNRKRKKCKPAKVSEDSEVQSAYEYSDREDSDILSIKDSTDREDVGGLSTAKTDLDDTRTDEANQECVVIMCEDERKEGQEDTSV